MGAFHAELMRVGSWPTIGLLFGGCLACTAGFAIRQQVTRLGAPEAPGQVLDARLWYEPDEAESYLRRIGKGGRNLYATTQLTLDVVYPLLYSGLLCCLTARLCPPHFGRYWVWLPVAAAAADLGENAAIAYLAWAFDDAVRGVAWAAGGLTALKWSLLAVWLVGWIIGAIVRCLRRTGEVRAPAADTTGPVVERGHGDEAK